MQIFQDDTRLRFERKRHFAALVALIPLIPAVICLSIGLLGNTDIIFLLVGIGFAAFTVLAFVYSPRHAVLEFDREAGRIDEQTRIFRGRRDRQFDLTQLEQVKVHHKRSRSRGTSSTLGYRDATTDGGGGGSSRIRLVFSDGPVDILSLQLNARQVREAVDRINIWLGHR